MIHMETMTAEAHTMLNHPMAERRFEPRRPPEMYASTIGQVHPVSNPKTVTRVQRVHAGGTRLGEPATKTGSGAVTPTAISRIMPRLRGQTSPASHVRRAEPMPAAPTM
ncbi:MAG: hypothetical protein DYG94_12180 [Leptolyngbya sp. PLA3]|nr:MAG: hypothetical protein EDM82_13720 [Cyanobacteria bacterium CYA]MCE7969482.1 hypothetical protein [Leptolyngbya sp. PL-A3]